jgi:hypothetical protein
MAHHILNDVLVVVLAQLLPLNNKTNMKEWLLLLPNVLLLKCLFEQLSFDIVQLKRRGAHFFGCLAILNQKQQLVNTKPMFIMAM